MGQSKQLGNFSYEQLSNKSSEIDTAFPIPHQFNSIESDVGTDSESHYSVVTYYLSVETLKTPDHSTRHEFYNERRVVDS